MSEEECLVAAIDIPDYVVTIFWVFITVMMLALMFVAVCACLNHLLEYYYSRRWDYLKNKELKAQLEKVQKKELKEAKNELIEGN